MSRIYQVTTPTGIRLVEANTKAQAIGHCVSTDYSAEPISSSDLYAAMQSGAQVEKVIVPEKKPLASGELSSSLAQPGSPPPAVAGATTQAIASTQSPASTHQPSSVAPQASTVTQPPSGAMQPQQAPAQPQTVAAAAPVATPTASAAPAPKEPATAPAGGWQPPAHAHPAAPSVNPVLAEQQRINPEAAAAAGAPAPILARAPAPALPPEAPKPQGEGWTDRSKA